MLSATIDAGDPVTDVPGLTINADGSWEFDPSNLAYSSLPAGSKSEIKVTYSVTDGGELSGENTFTIEVTGINQSPVKNLSLIHI